MGIPRHVSKTGCLLPTNVSTYTRNARAIYSSSVREFKGLHPPFGQRYARFFRICSSPRSISSITPNKFSYRVNPYAIDALNLELIKNIPGLFVVWIQDSYLKLLEAMNIKIEDNKLNDIIFYQNFINSICFYNF